MGAAILIISSIKLKKKKNNTKATPFSIQIAGFWGF